MQIVTSLLGLLASTQAIAASPFTTSHALAPVPVTTLQCDGNTYQCTANLDFGDGRWVGQWSVAVFHSSLTSDRSDRSAMADISMAPVGVTDLNCDGNTYKCTANLDFGDGRWVAQWSANVYHKSSLKFLKQGRSTGSLAPVPANDLTCDGNTYKCAAALDFGDGNWVADWSANVFHSFSAGQF